jgi:hypothetical protein
MGFRGSISPSSEIQIHLAETLGFNQQPPHRPRIKFDGLTPSYPAFDALEYSPITDRFCQFSLPVPQYDLIPFIIQKRVAPAMTRWLAISNRENSESVIKKHIQGVSK